MPLADRTKLPGAFLMTGSRDKSIRLWDCQTGQPLRTFSGHDNWIRALIFHPTGKYLISASDDKTIKVWDLATGRCTKTIDAHAHFVTCMAWGRTTVGGGGGGMANGHMNGDVGKKEEPRRVNVLATGSVDQTIRVGITSSSTLSD